jgi:hypothetical protein
MSISGAVTLGNDDKNIYIHTLRGDLETHVRGTRDRCGGPPTYPYLNGLADRSREIVRLAKVCKTLILANMYIHKDSTMLQVFVIVMALANTEIVLPPREGN